MSDCCLNYGFIRDFCLWVEKLENWTCQRSKIGLKGFQVIILKSYRTGIKKFEEYYKKGIETLIGSDNAGKVLENFFVWLKEQGYTQNSARNLVNAPIQFLKFFNTPVKYRKSLGMYKTVPTTRDHMLTVDEARELYKVGDLREKIMVKTWLLGLRISDASRLEWKQFEVPNPSEEPIEVQT